MQKSESIVNITKAIISCMKEVKGIDKTMTVGSGNSAYKGVSDQEVKKEIGKAMERNGLAIVPTEVTPNVRIDRWEEIDQYAKVQGATKQKQAVFAEVTTKYLLIHDSGEWMELAGYGHGADTQDKAAGKATTYALKYTLLYTFMVPTGKIDDADNTHSDDYPVRQPVKANTAPVDLNAEIDKCKTVKETVVLYNKYQTLFDVSKELKAALGTKRDALKELESKPA